MRRRFGSAIHNVVFEPNTLALQQLVNYVVRQAAMQWCPHIVINDVLVKQTGEEVAVGVVFSLSEDRATQDRVILIKKSDVVNLLAGARR